MKSRAHVGVLVNDERTPGRQGQGRAEVGRVGRQPRTGEVTAHGHTGAQPDPGHPPTTPGCGEPLGPGPTVWGAVRSQ